MCDRGINIAQISAIFRFEFGMVLMSIYVFHFIKNNKKTSIENKDSATTYYKQYTNTMYRCCHRGQMSSDLPTGLVVVYINLHGILSLQLIE